MQLQGGEGLNQWVKSGLKVPMLQEGEGLNQWVKSGLKVPMLQGGEGLNQWVSANAAERKGFKKS
jgi:hypothetical protein